MPSNKFKTFKPGYSQSFTKKRRFGALGTGGGLAGDGMSSSRADAVKRRMMSAMGSGMMGMGDMKDSKARYEIAPQQFRVGMDQDTRRLMNTAARRSMQKFLSESTGETIEGDAKRDPRSVIGTGPRNLLNCVVAPTLLYRGKGAVNRGRTRTEKLFGQGKIQQGFDRMRAAQFRRKPGARNDMREKLVNSKYLGVQNGLRTIARKNAKQFKSGEEKRLDALAF